MYSLAGKTAVITGSLSGIGLGIARSLSRVGCNIVLNGFAPQAHIDATVKELTTKTNKVKFIHADLSKPADAKKLIKESLAAFGGVDILVNNAGKQHTAPIEQFPDETWEEIISLNLSSSYYTSKAAISYMQGKNWGRIINIASVHGLVASINKSAYVAAKHGLVGLSKVIALENATKGITCNTICPGWVLTPLIQEQINKKALDLKVSEPDARKNLLSEKQPSQKFTNPEDIGELVVFLSSKYADNITGAAYTLDGGWTAQ